jgi:tetratricopeptide (TPR) repeat protein/tRNA A-37 threonylcarbamoyl transferase component Bud32
MPVMVGRLVDILRTELERLFTASEMLRLVELVGIGGLVGIPADAGSFTTKAAIARAIAERAVEEGRADALVDVMSYARSSVDEALSDLDALLTRALAPGETFGPFTAHSVVGPSTRGTVYRASHPDGEPRALEILSDRFSRDRRAVYRFLTANRLVATIPHPALVTKLEAGETDGVFWVAHTWVDGAPLTESLAETWTELRPIALGIAEGLAALHRAHIVHAGLHPENVVVGASIRLVGFGTDYLLRDTKRRSADLRADVHAFGELFARMPSPPTEIGALLEAIAANRGPFDADALLTELAAIDRASSRRLPIADTRLRERIDKLLAAPDDEGLARDLEAAVDEGADPERVARAFVETAPRSATPAVHLRRALRIAEAPATAEAIALDLVDRDPNDAHAFSRLVDARFKLGKHEEIVEAFLSRAERAAAGEERARLYADLGRLYADEDPDQAAVAYARALLEMPTSEVHARALEQLAGNKRAIWVEQLELLHETDSDVLLARVARWYDEKLGERQRALSLYRSLLAKDPRNDAAAEGLVSLLRRLGAHQDVVDALVTRAEALGSVPRARDASITAAETLMDRLDQPGRARDLAERVLAEDPGHERASELLVRIAEQEKDAPRVVKLLERRADTRSSTARAGILVRIALAYERSLGDIDAAAERFEEAARLDPASSEALDGVVRTFRARGRLDALAAVLEELVASPRRGPDVASRLAELLVDRAAERDEAPLSMLERAVQLGPNDPRVLAAVGRAREGAGDIEGAIAVARALAERTKAGTDHLRLARLLETKGDRAAALTAFRAAYEAEPNSPTIAAALRRAYVARGETAAAVALAEAELRAATTDRARSMAWAALAELEGDRVKAEAAAQKALALDPANARAKLVIGDAAFAFGRFGAAAAAYDAVVPFVSDLAPEDARRMLVRLLRATASVPDESSRSRAKRAVDAAISIGVDDDTLVDATDALWTLGRNEDALRLAAAAPATGRALHRLGESAHRVGDHARAEDALEKAIALGSWDAARSLAKVLAEKGDRDGAMEALRSYADHAPPDARIPALFDVADAHVGLGRNEEAARALESIRAGRPADRRALTKLMHAYSALEAWPKLLEVITTLAGLVDDVKQRAKYLHTAAGIAVEHTGEIELAARLLEQSLAADPELERALDDAITVRKKLGQDIEPLLKRRLAIAKERGEPVAIATALDALADVYHGERSEPELAIEALEAAQAWAPGDARAAKLAELYGESRSFDKAVAAELSLLRKDPYKAEGYGRLFSLYEKAGRADGAFCMAQASALLGFADEKAATVYEAHRARDPAVFARPLTEAERAMLLDPNLDPLLTRVFASVEPAIVRGRIAERNAEPVDASFTTEIHDAASALGLALPRLQSADGPPIAYAPAREPLLLLGSSGDISAQGFAFWMGRALSALRPGFAVPLLLTTGTGLKAWLFAAIKTCVPQFPIPPDLGGPVGEAMRRLDLGPEAYERLASAVSTLLREDIALDLKKWLLAIDRSADRVGLLLANDLRVATEVVRETSAPDTLRERMKDLVLFSVSEEYVALRRALVQAACLG